MTIDALTLLRDIADGAEVATASEAGIAIAARYMGHQVVMVNVTDIDGASGNETYVLDVEVSDVIAGTYTSIAELTLDRDMTVPALFPISVHGQTVQLLDADAAFMRITATLGGTSPSLTYGAYLAPTQFANAPGQLANHSN